MRVLFLVLGLIATISSATAANVSRRPQAILNAAPLCGAANAAPTAIDWDAKDREPRSCDPATARDYVPKFKGLGFEILTFESEACFVPDQSFRLLDDIVGTVVSRVAAAPPSDPAEKAMLVSTITSSVLTEFGFALWIPTRNLSDALISRRTDSDRYRYLFDCDTGSMILLTVAQALGMDATLVESTIPSNTDPRKRVQHNFVRWTLADRSEVNWDMNMRTMCSTPTLNQLPYQGKPLTMDQLWSYEKQLRGSLWERTRHYSESTKDFRQAAAQFPERDVPYNNFAWTVATKTFPERASFVKDALEFALKAVAISGDANNLDTLACVYAHTGDFQKAIATEKRAVDAAPQKSLPDFRRRLQGFSTVPPQDCTGED
ncbi:MAG: hypothetical protein HZA66_08840 [Rhodopseudomonas palustris]|uniref:Tetratricopeptide repeat protein n=1 Tax=Rhodopseudomonas palustris TaxID=1076 RepID=A0A933RVQ7_RHOPL|nr:hypothetical protein [Rhodopseudomonas palustris]